MVTPSTEDELASLFVEWVVRDVDFTHGFEHTTRLPVYSTTSIENGTELPVVSVDTIRPEKINTSDNIK